MDNEKTIKDLYSTEALPLDDAAMYRAAIETCSDGFHLVDSEGRILEANNAYVKRSGYTREELLTMNVSDLEVIEKPEETAAHIAKVMRYGSDLFETLHRAKDGTIWSVEINVSYQLIDGGRFFCFLRDITERKWADEALQEQEATLRSIDETSQDWIWEMDLSGKHTFSNARVADILGYSLDDFLSMDFHDLLHPEDGDEIKSKLPQLISEKSGWREWVIRWRSKDGSYRFLESYANPVLNKSGELVGYRGVDRDITERKLGQETLAHSHDLMRYIIEHNRSCVAVHDRDLKYIYVSQRYLDEYKVKEKDVIGKHHYDVFPDLPQKWRDVHQKALAGEISSAEDDPYEREDGTVDWTRWECRPWYEADGSIGGIIIYTEIITEHKKTEEQLRHTLSLLKATLESTTDGILVVSKDGSIFDFNEHFVKLWNIPKTVLDLHDGQQALNFMLEQLKNPEQFISKVRELYATPETNSFDVLEFKDGRIYERYSQPQIVNGCPVGRVWIFRDISMQKNTEDKLLESEERFRLAMQGANDGLWDWNFLTDEVYYSPRWKAMLGYTEDELENTIETWKRLVSPDDREPALAMVREVIEGHKNTYEVEFRMQHKDGHYLDILSRAFLARGAAGEALRLVGTHMDISELKRTGLALQASERFLQTIIDTEPECVKLVDENANLIMMNRAGLDMLQADSLEQVKGQCICPLVASEYRQPFMDLTKRVFQGGTGTLLFEVIGMKGRHLWLQTNAVPLRNEKDEIFALLGVTRDVTKSRENEEKLRQSEEFVRSILDTVDEGFIVVDRDYRIITANKAYCSQVGGCDNTIIGKHCYEISHKTDRPCYEEGEDCATRHAFETGTPHTALHRHKDANGTLLYVETKAYPIKDDSGAVTSVIETINNITEKYLLEEERLKTQKLESIGTLAGGIAHDFNNLLQGVFGYISMAKLTHDQKDKSLAMLDQAEEALHMSVNLTTQLLTFAKGGKPVIKLIRIEPTIENAVKFALSGSHTDYLMEITPELWSVEADAGQLAQVIQNIVLNANEAMAGGGTVTISVRNMDIHSKAKPKLPDGGQFVRIDIQDTGTGISEQNILKIFDPYFTTKQRGNGLGLATSYSIIKNHGGLIEVRSEPNKGTTFTIYLPASKEEKAAIVKTTPTAATTNKIKILLMDDEDVVRNVAKEMIAALGHEVEGAEDGKRAIELFSKARGKGRPFDLIILDLTVKGGMGGQEAIARIREIDPTVKAVVSSGYADSPIVGDYRTYGFSAVLNKPYRLDALKDCLGMFVL